MKLLVCLDFSAQVAYCTKLMENGGGRSRMVNTLFAGQQKAIVI